MNLSMTLRNSALFILTLAIVFYGALAIWG